jgi:demethylspheroidene O-methyltransferase
VPPESASVLPQGPKPVAASLSDRFHAFRNRIVANPRFQRWAAAFPLTRPIALRQSTALFDLCAGFVYSQVLAACVKLRLFEKLEAGPQSLAQLAPQLAMSTDAARCLLRAAASLRLLDARGLDAKGEERFGLGMLGAALLGNPGVSRMIAHHDMLYADLGEPVALLRSNRDETRLSKFWPYTIADDPKAGEGAVAETYSNLMSASQPLVSEEILGCFDFKPHRRHLDIGGGDGTFIRAIAAAAPQLSFSLFDLPPVAAVAERRFAAAGMASRVSLNPGNLHTDAFPAGHDLISLIRVLHDHEDAAVLSLLQRARQALAPGGALLIAEPMSGTPGAEAMGDAYFGFYLLAMGTGRPRTPDEITAMLKQAGFGKVRVLRNRRPLLARVLVASE